MSLSSKRGRMRVRGHALSMFTILGLSLLVAGAIALSMGTSLDRRSLGTLRASSPPKAPVPLTTLPPPSTKNTGPAETIAKVAFLNGNDGYGLFFENDAMSCGLAVGHTSDGGSLFSPRIPVTSTACNRLQPADSITFNNSGDGFVFRPGNLWRTTDGGSHWDEEWAQSRLHVASNSTENGQLRTSGGVPRF